MEAKKSGSSGILRLFFARGYGIMKLRHNSINVSPNREWFLLFGKNAFSIFAFPVWMLKELCRSNRSYAFFGGVASAAPLFIL